MISLLKIIRMLHGRTYRYKNTALVYVSLFLSFDQKSTDALSLGFTGICSEKYSIIQFEYWPENKVNHVNKCCSTKLLPRQCKILSHFSSKQNPRVIVE